MSAPNWIHDRRRKYGTPRQPMDTLCEIGTKPARKFPYHHRVAFRWPRDDGVTAEYESECQDN